MKKTNKIVEKLIGTKRFKRQEEKIGEHILSYLIHNEDKKVKDTFVLCHGAACNSYTMQPLANEIADKFPNSRVIVLDAPWHGQSTSTESIEGKNVNDYSTIVNELILTLIKKDKIQGKFTWLGWSMGGSLGLLAEKSGVPIDNLVLLCSSPYWGALEEMTSAIPALLDVNSSSDVWEGVILSEVADTDEDVLEVYQDNIKVFLSKPEVAVNDLKGLAPQHYDLRDEISQVTANTFIFGGTKDALANVELLELLHSEISESKLTIFDDVHGLVLKPNRVKEIVKSIKKHIKKQ